MRAANHWCRHDLLRVEHLKKPKNATEADRHLGIAIKAQDHLIFHLRSLAPPPPDATAYRALLATANDEELVGTNLQLAIEGRQIQAAKNHLKKLELLGKTFEVRALGLGLKACAKG